MGKYFNPVSELSQVGRQIYGGSYSELTDQLNADEQLVGRYDRLIFNVCPLLFDVGEFTEFESQYARGMFVSHGFFAVKNADVTKYVQ